MLEQVSKHAHRTPDSLHSQESARVPSTSLPFFSFLPIIFLSSPECDCVWGFPPKAELCAISPGSPAGPLSFPR